MSDDYEEVYCNVHQRLVCQCVDDAKYEHMKKIVDQLTPEGVYACLDEFMALGAC